MEMLKSLFETRAQLSLQDPALKTLFGGVETIAGARINPRSALNVSPWYACVRILSETIASLPFITYRRSEGGRSRALRHPVYRLMHDTPNPFMTSMEFLESQQGRLLGWGNSFSEIERNGRGEVTALWPIPPENMRLQVTPTAIFYWARMPESGEEVMFRQNDILHVRGLSDNGLIGYGIVDLLRESIGLAKIEEEYRARFFANDARPGAIIEYPGQMTDEAYRRYKNDWQDKYGGIGNKYRIAFLEQGLKYTPVTFTPEAAEFIEGRKFQKEEMAMITGVPLILLQGTEKATSWGTGIEQFLLAFNQFTIRPWLRRWERRLNISLFTPIEREQYFIEALIDDLLRADSRTRAEVLQIWRRNGIINADEWLALENRNPLPDGKGQIYIVEGNMTRLEDVGKQEAEGTPAIIE